MEKTVKLEVTILEAEILEHFLAKKATVTGIAAMEACVSLYWKTKKALDGTTEQAPPQPVEVPPK